jgi:hypothetical protein
LPNLYVLWKYCKGLATVWVDVEGEEKSRLFVIKNKHYLRVRTERVLSYFAEVFENRVLTRIFGPERDERTGEWRRLHNEKFNDLHSSPNVVRVRKSRRMGWAGHVAHMRERRGVHRMLAGRPEGRRPLGRSRRRWEDNIKMDLRKVGVRAWTGLRWLRIGTGDRLL